MRFERLHWVFALGLCLLPGLAFAANYRSASGGHTYYPIDDDCVVRTLQGRVMNTCGLQNEQRFWMIDPDQRSTGTKTLKVFGRSASASSGSANDTTCAAIVVNEDGNLKSWTGQEILPNTSGGWKGLSPNLTVDDEDTVQFECLLSNYNIGGRGYVSSVSGF
jgi:hypothetical protein